MGENLYGKFGFDVALIGFILFIVNFFISFTIGLFFRQIFTLIFIFVIFFNLIAIILGILGILRDDLKEKAIRALIAGVLFLVMGIVLYIGANWYYDIIT